MKISNVSFEAYDSPIYLNLMHINGCGSVILGLLAMYLIATKTPKSFGSYKYFLFNISFWAFVFDFYMTILHTPRLLFPALVMCPTGLLYTRSNTVAYIAFWLFLTFFGCSTVAVLSAFMYRYIALKGKLRKFLSLKWLIILGILHFIYELPTIILYALGISNRDEIDRAVLTEWPNIAPYYNGIGCAAIHFDVTPFPFMFMLSCIAAFTLGVPIVVTLVVKSFSTLKKQRNLMSPKTYKMHYQLLTTLTFQLLVPITTLFGPFIINSCLVMAGAENIAWLMQAALILGTLHSSFNTVMMLYFILPYRQAFLRIFRFKRISLVAAITTIDLSRTDAIPRMKTITTNYRNIQKMKELII